MVVGIPIQAQKNGKFSCGVGNPINEVPKAYLGKSWAGDLPGFFVLSQLSFEINF